MQVPEEILNRVRMLEANLEEDLLVTRQVLSDLEKFGQEPEPSEFVKYARIVYNDPDFRDGYHTQILQGQASTVQKLATIRGQTSTRRILRYAFPLTYTTHPDWRVRAAIRPEDFRAEWLGQNSSGQRIQSTKFNSGIDSAGKTHYNYLIDVSVPEYQRKSLEWLIEKCRNEGWTGIYLDEIVRFQSYTGYTRPKNYATEGDFQKAQLGYISFVAAGLKAAGYECFINLGWDYNAFADMLVDACDGQHTEFFIAENTVGKPLADEAEWNRQTEWLRRNEAKMSTGFYQADARNENEVRYALATFLLFTRGTAEFAAFNGGYGLGDAWWTRDMETALQLGTPMGNASFVTESATWIREFTHGNVLVSPKSRTASIGLRGT